MIIKEEKTLCGIAGIIYRDSKQSEKLGADLISIIQPLESRGPDSCGVAFYSDSATGSKPIKLIVRSDEPPSDRIRSSLHDWLRQVAPVQSIDIVADSYRILLNPVEDLRFDLKPFMQSLHQRFPMLHFMSAGHQLEIFKEVGEVQNLVSKYSLSPFTGSHGIAHTRMATESTVDLDHCHPFTSSYDLSIVHNGQLSNYYRLRFQLERAGIVFETHNDSEAIAHYVYYQLLQGLTLEETLEKFLTEVDGVYTFLLATPEKVALVRDQFAAKPAVIYETDEKVAIASEYRAFLNMPGFDPSATIREPDASEINVWTVGAHQRQPQLSTLGAK